MPKKRKPIWGIRLEVVQSSEGLLFEGFIDTLKPSNQRFFATTPQFAGLPPVFFRTIRGASVGKISVEINQTANSLVPRFVPTASFPDYLRGRWLGTFIQLQIANYLRRNYPNYLVFRHGLGGPGISLDSYVRSFANVLSERLGVARGRSKSARTTWLPGLEKKAPVRRPRK